MSAPKREQLANNAFTTLNGGITSGATTITVTDGSVFPSVGNFRIIIGDEILLCTARSTNDLTVVRGYEGTTPSAASNGANVVHVLTAGGLTRWAQDNEGLFGYSGSLPVGKIVNDAGDTLLTASDFTWVNQGTATVTDQNGTMVMRAPTAAGESVRMLTRTAPSTPYSYILAMQAISIREGFQAFGCGFRQSSSGKLTLFAVVNESAESRRVAIYKCTNATTFSSRLQTETNLLLVSKYVWFKLEDNGTSTNYYISMDGIEWIQVASESRTTFFLTTGPDEIWWGLNNNSSTTWEMLARLHHWSKV
jgi:hypothetical protein